MGQLEEFKPRALESCEFECRQNKNSNSIFQNFEPILTILACGKVKEFEFEDLSTDRKLLIITLMEEVKPIVMKKYKVEYRYISKLISFFAFSAYYHSDARMMIQEFSND